MRTLLFIILLLIDLYQSKTFRECKTPHGITSSVAHHILTTYMYWNFLTGVTNPTPHFLISGGVILLWHTVGGCLLADINNEWCAIMNKERPFTSMQRRILGNDMGVHDIYEMMLGLIDLYLIAVGKRMLF